MGIDIYMSWPNMSRSEKDDQATGFSVVSGDVGYLREAYHGGPYVTQYLVREAFEADNAEAGIPAQVMRDRLPKAVLLALYRRGVVYGEGEPGIVVVGKDDEDVTIGQLMNQALTDAGNARGNTYDDILGAVTDEQLRAVSELIARRDLPNAALAFVDFVDLAEKKEAEIGEPVTVYASY